MPIFNIKIISLKFTIFALSFDNFRVMTVLGNIVITLPIALSHPRAILDNSSPYNFSQWETLAYNCKVAHPEIFFKWVG